MGKKKSTNIESEPLFSPIKTTDDDDDDVELAQDGGPTTRYHDDPQAAASSSHSSSKHSTSRRGSGNDGGPPLRYRDDPTSSSIFDWGNDDEDNTAPDGRGQDTKDKEGGSSGDEEENNNEIYEREGKNVYQIDDEFGYEKKMKSMKKSKRGSTGSISSGSRRGGRHNEQQPHHHVVDDYGFSPVSLDDSSRESTDGGDDDDDDNSAGYNEYNVRTRANDLLKQRIFDDTTYDDTNERIFVGGGWGRHGSQFSCCPHGLFGWLCCKTSSPTYSRGPPKSRKTSLCQAIFVGVLFVGVVLGFGYLGYEAGLPVDNDGVDTDNADDGTGVQHHPHTKGEEWLEWLEHEKDEIHMPHFNFTRPHIKHSPNSQQAGNNYFTPKTQSELLHISENIFQSCSERSLRTMEGRSACTSLCHGHFCCFEKDPKLGSCVAETNAYCFAYAACENIIMDFGFDNVNTKVVASLNKNNNAQGGDGDNKKPVLYPLDIKLLEDTCSAENIATLEGIRDCTAFCEHHLCCFNTLASENCSKEFESQCEAYDSCRILVDGPPTDSSKGVATSGSGTGAAGGTSSSGGTASTSLSPVQIRTFKKDCMQFNLRDNWDLCKDHCAPMACCFTRQNSCYNERTLECEEYYICEEFYLDDGGEDGGKDYGTNHDVDGLQPAFSTQQDNNWYEGSQQKHEMNNNSYNKGTLPQSDIETAVAAVCGLGADNPSDDSWVTACHALCSNYLCCFSAEGTQSNCRDSYGDEVCNAYQGCYVLTSSEIDEPVTEDYGGDEGNEHDSNNDAKQQAEVTAVNESCIYKAKRDPWLAEKCRKACDARSCCFAEDPGNCSAMNQDWCDEFEHCNILYGT